MSTALAALAGVPLGVFIGLKAFPGRSGLVAVLNTLMSMPTVVVGLLVYSAISRTGPLGSLGLLYSITAMVLGQFVLSFPIITALTVSTVGAMDERIHKTILSLGATPCQSFLIFLREAKFGLLAALVAGFGRVFGEIGVSIMLGGNIKGYTRNITTTIALETSKGDFFLVTALGMALLFISLVVNISLGFLQRRGR